MKLANVPSLFTNIEKALSTDIDFSIKKNLIKIKLELRQKVEFIDTIKKQILKDNKDNKDITITELNNMLNKQINSENDFNFDKNLLICYDEQKMQNLDSNVLESLVYYGIITKFK